ncbi:MAG TPA: cation transporter [Verrucomicrobiales bacterium]|nr:cation transporter [Verrucomicrobiales bacterium]HAH97949.1 cation transporter [Verrucomicrobiales bacterium]
MKYTYSFLVLFAPWLVLSGKFDAMHVGMGVICCLLLSYLCADLLFQDSNTSTVQRLRQLVKFTTYLGWLFWQIIIANFHVFRVAFSPRMEKLLSPRMVTFETQLKKELSRFVLANSITLTPGTVTVRVEGSRFLVHALNETAARDLPGSMEQRIANIFEKNL